MKPCPNCGNMCRAADIYCKSCGYAFPKNPAEKKTGAKKALRAALIVLCALLTGTGVFFGVRAFLRRQNIRYDADFITVQADTLGKRFDWIQAFRQETFAADLSIGAEIGGDSRWVEKLEDILPECTLVVKTDYTGPRLLLDILLNISGSNVLEGFLTVSAGQLGFSVPALEDDFFVLAASETERFLPFDPCMTLDVLDVVLGFACSGKPEEELANYLPVLQGQILPDAILAETVPNAAFPLLNRTADCTVITWQPDEERLKTLFQAWAGLVEEDTTLASFLLELDTARGFAPEKGAQDVARENAGNFRQQADAWAEDLVDHEARWILKRLPDGSLAGITIATDDAEISWECLETEGVTEEAFAVKENGAQRFGITNSFSREEEEKTGTLSVSTPYGRIALRYHADDTKRSVFHIPYGTYEADLSGVLPGISLSLEVGGQEGAEDDHIIRVAGLSRIIGNADIPDAVTLHIRTEEGTTAREPEGVRRDISSYTAEDFETLWKGMRNRIVYLVMTTPSLRGLALDLIWDELF